MTEADPVVFEGFSRELLEFLRGLERNNEKAWFDRHRDAYEAFYLEPAKAFARSIAVALPALGSDLRSEPRVNGSIMRINRDVRFSKDKTPYKTALHFIFAGGDGPLKVNPAFYLRVAPASLGLGAGIFGFDPDQLARYRAAVVDARRGRALRTALEKVRKAGPYDLRAPDTKRVPKGFDADHRNALLLRYRGCAAFGELPHPDELFTGRAVTWVIDRFRGLRPLHDWLVKALAD